MAISPSDPTALAGVKVLDLSRILAGPSATQMLADLGADVVKVENPNGGDDTRGWGPPFIEDDNGVRSEAAYFACCNRNKRSVTLDFTTEEGAQSARELASKADILVENFKPGGLQKYSLDYESLKALNPGLIYCSITGFGHNGPYANRPGYDFLIQGMGGLMSITGQPDGSPGAEPLKVGVAICDLFTGLNAVSSILAALYYRTRSGEGQHIDCALLDCQVAMLANQSSNWLNCGITPRRMGNNHPSIVPYRVFAVADGHVIINCGNDGQFSRLCGALNVPEMAEDARFKSNEARCDNRELTDQTIADLLVSYEKQTLISLLEAVNVPCGPINNIPAVFADPHLQHRQMEVNLEREDGAVFKGAAFPAKLSKTPARYDRPPPRLGEHEQAVFEEWGLR
jgi:crotonobetainyl-CoA:carnitine CoA-transferase CaiB-like acyl-CoA transferase